MDEEPCFRAHSLATSPGQPTGQPALEEVSTTSSYVGGNTSTAFHDDALYCSGSDYLFRFSLTPFSVTDSWVDPEQQTEVDGEQLGAIWSTNSELIGWSARTPRNTSAIVQIDAASLTQSILLTPQHFAAIPNLINVGPRKLIAYSDLKAFDCTTKQTEELINEVRPWGGDWNARSEFETDGDYYYWVEGWTSPAGAPDGGDKAHRYLVRYPIDAEK